MRFEVVLLPDAEQDLYEILAWIRMRSPQGAVSWARRWDEVFHSLEETAHRCATAPEDEDHDATIQQITFKTRQGNRYRAIFTIRETTAFVIHIRGPGQDLVSLGDLDLPDE